MQHFIVSLIYKISVTAYTNQFCLCIKFFEPNIFDNWLMHHTNYQFSIGKQFPPLLPICPSEKNITLGFHLYLIKVLHNLTSLIFFWSLGHLATENEQLGMELLLQTCKSHFLSKGQLRLMKHSKIPFSQSHCIIWNHGQSWGVAVFAPFHFLWVSS